MTDFIDYIWHQKDFIYDPEMGKTFSTYHLLMLGGTILLFWVVWLIGAKFKNKRIFMMMLAIILLILEVLRVVNFMEAFNKDVIASLSFHMCSIAIYFAVITGIFNKKWMYDVIFVQAIIGAPLALLLPIGILPWFNPYSFLPIQSFISHMILCFMPVFAWRYRLWDVKLKNFKIAVTSVLVSTWIAYVMSLYNEQFQTGGSTNFFWTRAKDPMFDLIWNLDYPYYLIVLLSLFLGTGFIFYLIFKFLPQKKQT